MKLQLHQPNFKKLSLMRTLFPNESASLHSHFLCIALFHFWKKNSIPRASTMVVSSRVAAKDNKKTPAAQLKRQVTVSPSLKSVEDEIIYLRSQNKLLKNALNAVKNTASDKLCKSYELVWYARNRTRYPSHQVSKWLDSSKEHSRDIDNLHSADGDFHHGFNSGVLAASRMFKDHADVSHVDNDSEEMFDSAHQAVMKHQEKIDESREAFPNASADTFPVLRADSN